MCGLAHGSEVKFHEPRHEYEGMVDGLIADFMAFMADISDGSVVVAAVVVTRRRVIMAVMVIVMK